MKGCILLHNMSSSSIPQFLHSSALPALRSTKLVNYP